MYCRNCGEPLPPDSNICAKCGVPAGIGNHHCPNCGSSTEELAVVCVNCGAQLGPGYKKTSNVYVRDGITYQKKSKLAAGLLGILLGWLGIHNFYLGYTDRAIVQVLLGTVGSLLCGLGPMISGIWGLVEGIQIFTGSIQTDAQGIPLGE